jgi:hypothetical protein
MAEEDQWKEELYCLNSIVDGLSLAANPAMAAETDTPPLTVDQICDFLELLHQFLNNDTTEPRLRFLLMDSRPDLFTVLFNFAKHRDHLWLPASGDVDSPRVRREVLRVICRVVALCKGASGSADHPDGDEGAPSLAGLCSQAVMNEDGVATILLVLTTETDDVARAHCAEALARLCEGSQMTMLSVMVQRGLSIIITSLSRDSSPQVRRFCILALGAFSRGYSMDVVKDGGVQVLVERLSIDSNTSVRSLSAEILAHLLYNHREATVEAVTRRGLAQILHQRILEDSSTEVVDSCLRLIELLTRLREGGFCADFVRLGGAPAIMKRLRCSSSTAKLALRTVRTLVECAPKSLQVAQRIVMHFQSLSTLMELALDDQAENPEAYSALQPADMYDEAQLKAELALTLGIVCAHSVACRNHLSEELGRLPMWAKSIRHRLLSALQDISPNSFSDLMVYDEENVLLNSTQDWDGEDPHGRAKAELAEQTDRYSARMEAQDAGEEMPIPDTPNREDVEAGASWSMVGTQAALALTKEILRQALESALKCAAREPPKLISDEQKAALFAKIQEAMEECGGRLLETFRRFDKDRNGFVEVSELCNMLESMGMVFLNSEKKGIVQLFDLNRDNRITYKEFLRVVADNTGSCRGTGALHSRGRSAAASLSPTSAGSSMPRSTSQYQQYLASMNEKSSKAGGSTARSKKSQSSCPKSSTASRPAKPSQVAAPQATKELDTAAMDPDHRLAFKLEFTHVTEDTITQKVKMAKRHCVQVRKELVILPANRRPRRAALLAASSKAEKYRAAWETLQSLIKAQGEGMVQETLAAMYVSIITELNLVNVVNELSNRFPIPDDSCYAEGQAQGSGANSLGPLGLTASPSALQSSGGVINSPGYQQDYNDESDSTDSEDDLGDLQLLGIASH